MKNKHLFKCTMKKLLLITIGLFLAVIVSSCWVSRLSRPQITGVIVDYNKNPIQNCKVGETVTDSTGHFLLPEKRYIEFVPIIVMEAPPMFVREPIRKEGFVDSEIHSFSQFGGSGRKGSKWEMDTIFLEKKNQKFNIRNLLEGNWEFSGTDNYNTLYFIKNSFRENCKTKNCQDFYYRYSAYNDDYYNSGPKKLPQGILKRAWKLQFINDHTFQAQRIRTFDNDSILYELRKQPDTLAIKGEWIIEKELQLQLKTTFSEMNKTFKIDSLNIFYFKLIETRL